jgi:hypothetical protein
MGHWEERTCHALYRVRRRDDFIEGGSGHQHDGAWL